MRFRSLTALSVFSVALLASGAASATPTLTIDGITIPNGIAPGGNLITTEGSAESVVQAHNDVLQGISKVTDISNSVFQSTYGGYGANNVYLVSVFEGFTVDTILAPTATTAGQITFTGGTLKYYVSSTDNFSVTQGSQALDIALAKSGTLWLSLAPNAVDASGHTAVITIDAGSTASLISFQHASASAFLDVVGGDAASAFNTNSISDPFAPGGLVDVFFQGTASSSQKGDFPISGSNDLLANAIPEPVSISLFGGGLAVMGAFVRRRKAKAKKA